MTWLEKITQELSRVFPSSNITVESSEAEVVDALQQLPVAGATPDDDDDDEDRIGPMQTAIESVQSSLLTQETTIKNFESQLETLKTGMDEMSKVNAKALADLKADFGKELATIKAGSTTQSESNGGAPIKPGKTGEETSTMKVEMQSLFDKEIVPGLGL